MSRWATSPQPASTSLELDNGLSILFQFLSSLVKGFGVNPVPIGLQLGNLFGAYTGVALKAAESADADLLAG
jgi:hypothetical protein